MKRYRDDRPVDVCFARGTFNSHPYVMGVMYEFRSGMEEPDIRALYDNLEEIWTERRSMASINVCGTRACRSRSSNMSSIWTVIGTQPSRQQLDAAVLSAAVRTGLSWIGTGRLIFSLNYTNEEFQAVADRFVGAVRTMHQVRMVGG